VVVEYQNPTPLLVPPPEGPWQEPESLHDANERRNRVLARIAEIERTLRASPAPAAGPRGHAARAWRDALGKEKFAGQTEASRLREWIRAENSRMTADDAPKDCEIIGSLLDVIDRLIDAGARLSDGDQAIVDDAAEKLEWIEVQRRQRSRRGAAARDEDKTP
jgi:hypothetical protein